MSGVERCDEQTERGVCDRPVERGVCLHSRHHLDEIEEARLSDEDHRDYLDSIRD